MKEYSTDEYEVKIGDPVVDAEVKASSTSVAIPCEAIADGEYLVSLEVNGTVVSRRELMAFASGSCTVGDYTLAYSSYAVTVSTTEENDVVRLKVEPVEVYVTDAMKAAVAKVAPKSEGGGSGGGRFVVTFSQDPDTEEWSADKTLAECVAAWNAGQTLFAFEDGVYYHMSSVATESGEVTYIAFYLADAESNVMYGYGIDAEGAYYYGGGE